MEFLKVISVMILIKLNSPREHSFAEFLKSYVGQRDFELFERAHYEISVKYLFTIRECY